MSGFHMLVGAILAVDAAVANKINSAEAKRVFHAMMLDSLPGVVARAAATTRPDEAHLICENSCSVDTVPNIYGSVAATERR